MLQRLEPARTRVVVLEQQSVRRGSLEYRLWRSVRSRRRPTSGWPGCPGTGAGRRSRHQCRPSPGCPRRRPDPAIRPCSNLALHRTRVSWIRAARGNAAHRAECSWPRIRRALPPPRAGSALRPQGSSRAKRKHRASARGTRNWQKARDWVASPWGCVRCGNADRRTLRPITTAVGGVLPQQPAPLGARAASRRSRRHHANRPRETHPGPTHRSLRRPVPSGSGTTAAASRRQSAP